MTDKALSLNELQQAFQSAVLQLQDTPPDFVVDTDQASSTVRFKVYTDAYRLRLIEALSADYPALQQYLGDEDYDTMCRAYIDTSPSDQFSIRWFGRHLNRFLTAAQPYASQAEVAELTAFEWALSEAFDAPDKAVIDYNRMAAIAADEWPSLKLTLHPSLRRIDLQYNTPQIWQAATDKDPLPLFTANPDTQAWIIWRQHLKLLFRSLSVEEAFAVDAFIKGESFADVCSGLCEWFDEEQVIMHAAGYLQAWLRDGWIVECRFQ
ncbi:MAG: DNA-binding domain-containing protein [Methylococcales bacterium]|nr:DUF2063 domain-containing protein [Methylococcaceae bacterium]